MKSDTIGEENNPCQFSYLKRHLISVILLSYVIQWYYILNLLNLYNCSKLKLFKRIHNVIIKFRISLAELRSDVKTLQGK